MTVHSGVWSPTGAGDAKKLAGSCEVTNLSLKAGTGSAYVAFYNGKVAADATPTNLRWVLDASAATSDNEKFDGLTFENGVYAVCEQGDSSTRVCISSRQYITDIE